MPPPHPEQQQEQRLRSVEDAARRLSILLQAPATQQLLQQALPDGPLTAEQQQQVSGVVSAVTKLTLAINDQLQDAPAAGGAAAGAAATTGAAVWGRMLGLALRHHAARNVGILLVWLQQQPQLLPFKTMQRRLSRLDSSLPTTACAWMQCFSCLSVMTTALNACCTAGQLPGGCNAAALAAAMLQQLEQSGGLRRSLLWFLLYHCSQFRAACVQVHGHKHVSSTSAAQECLMP
jgi:hypothetical protein